MFSATPPPDAPPAADLHAPNRRCRRAFSSMVRKGLTEREAFDKCVAQGLYFLPRPVAKPEGAPALIDHLRALAAGETF